MFTPRRPIDDSRGPARESLQEGARTLDSLTVEKLCRPHAEVKDQEGQLLAHSSRCP